MQSMSPEMAQPMFVVQQSPTIQDERLVRRGINPANGRYKDEKYCGLYSVLIGVFAFPCICCCPIDQREVFITSEGRRVVLKNDS